MLRISLIRLGFAIALSRAAGLCLYSDAVCIKYCHFLSLERKKVTKESSSTHDKQHMRAHALLNWNTIAFPAAER